MLYATIIRTLGDGRIHVRISAKSADADGDVEVIDVLQGEKLEELRARADRFVKERLGRLALN